MGRGLSDRTLAICRTWNERKEKDHDERVIIRDLSNQYGILRPAVWKALRKGKAVPPYNAAVDGKPGRPAGGGQPGYSSERLARSAATEQQKADRARPPADARPATSEPCGRCGVRADVGCSHQPAHGTAPLAIEQAQARRDGRSRPNGMQGWGFHPMTREEAARLADQLRSRG